MVKKKSKKSPKAKAKKKAWDAFSKFIKTRDCLLTTGDSDYGICITCGKQFDFKALQAGHSIGGRTNRLLFDESITNAQCKGCNIYGHGRYDIYTSIMIGKMGKEAYDNKYYKKGDYLKILEIDFLEIEKDLKLRTQRLLDGLKDDSKLMSVEKILGIEL